MGSSCPRSGPWLLQCCRAHLTNVKVRETCVPRGEPGCAGTGGHGLGLPGTNAPEVLDVAPEMLLRPEWPQRGRRVPPTPSSTPQAEAKAVALAPLWGEEGAQERRVTIFIST